MRWMGSMRKGSSMSATTEPLAYGPSRNPWNPDHSTGGSSGGPGAAVGERDTLIRVLQPGGRILGQAHSAVARRRTLQRGGGRRATARNLEEMAIMAMTTEGEGGAAILPGAPGGRR